MAEVKYSVHGVVLNLRIRDGARMFQLALFAHRPLTLAEFQHALAIEDDPNAEFVPSDYESFEYKLIEGIDKRIIQCGGNFLEIKNFDGTFSKILLQLFG